MTHFSIDASGGQVATTGWGVNVYFVVMASLIQNTFSAGIRTKNECVQEAKSNIGQEIPNVQPADTFKLGRDCQAPGPLIFQTRQACLGAHSF